jgi:hypothetical protein
MVHAAQTAPQPDAEIAEKGHFWMTDDVITLDESPGDLR